MQALIYSDWNQVQNGDWPEPKIAPDEVLLRVEACGLCGSELEAFKNRSPRRVPPLVLGHEFCGIIEQVGGAVRNWEVGQAVVSNALVACGQCVRCRRGDTHLCANRQIFGMNRQGAFAPLVNVPARALLKRPENLAATSACLAEPLANGVHVAHLAERFRPQTALVIGAGPIGLFALQTLRVMLGATVWACDLSPERLEIARRLGAQSTLVSNEADVAEEIRNWTDGEGVDVVVDAAGVGATKQLSMECARPGGACIWIGLGQNTISLDSYNITLPERAILGSYGSTQEEMQLAIDLMAQGKVDAHSWTHLFPLDRGVEAFERMLAARGNDIKAVITP